MIAPAPSFNSGALLAMEVGEFDIANGVDIEYTTSGVSSTNLIAAVLSGDFDFAAPSASTALDAINQGGELVIVGAAVRTASSLVATNEFFEDTGVSPDSSLEERVEALRGKTIVTSALGSGSAVALSTILREYGLDPDADVNIVNVNEVPAMVAGLRQGRFDAGFYGSGQLEILAVDGEGDILLRAAEVPALAEQLRLVVVATPEFVEENPEVTQRVYDSLAAALESIHDDPELYKADVQQTFFPDLAPEVFDIAWDSAAVDYPLAPTYTRSAFDAMLENQTVETGNDYTSLVYEEAIAGVAQE